MSSYAVVSEDKEQRVNIRSTPEEVSAWREAAEADHLDLTTWLRRLAWQAVEKWRAARGKAKIKRDGGSKKR